MNYCRKHLNLLLDFLIKFLGGTTKGEVITLESTHKLAIDSLKDQCEDFYKEYCHLYGNVHSGTGIIDGISTEGAFVLTSSYSGLTNSDVGTLVYAPWVRSVYVQSVRVKGAYKEVKYDLK